MSNIALPASLQSAKIDTYTRTAGADTVNVQTFVSANPLTATTGNIAVNAATVVATGLGDMDGILVTVSGTFAGTIAFEASVDGISWYAILMNRASSTTQESTRALTGATLEAWRANIAGWSRFRVRCTAYTSGTAVLALQPVSEAFEPAIPPLASITATLAAGTNLAADVAFGVRTTATNALSVQKIISAAGTNATIAKATAGRLYGWNISNTTATFKFLKLYNKATAPTVGTDVPVQTVAIPPNGNVDLKLVIGAYHAAGIVYAITGAFADTDTTVVAAGDVIGALFYA